MNQKREGRCQKKIRALLVMHVIISANAMITNNSCLPWVRAYLYIQMYTQLHTLLWWHNSIGQYCSKYHPHYFLPMFFKINMKNFILTEELKRQHSEYPYALHLESPIVNILHHPFSLFFFSLNDLNLNCRPHGTSSQDRSQLGSEKRGRVSYITRAPLTQPINLTLCKDIT